MCSLPQLKQNLYGRVQSQEAGIKGRGSKTRRERENKEASDTGGWLLHPAGLSQELHEGKRKAIHSRLHPAGWTQFASQSNLSYASGVHISENQVVSLPEARHS